MKKYVLNLYIFCFIHCAASVRKELTVYIDPNREDCFYQTAKKGDIIDVDYQVIDGGHGELDITFHLVDPTGKIIVADYKKSENTHTAESTLDGDWRFCFDNSFSSYNAKTVYFEISVGLEDEWGEADDEPFDFDDDTLKSSQVLDLQIGDVQEIINKVRGHLNNAVHLQDALKADEARDRNIAEENYFKVNTYSLCQLFIMFFVGFIQVVMVKSLFDDQSKASKIWKNFR
nr:unnamed protein product [Callosobruchus analis]